MYDPRWDDVRERDDGRARVPEYGVRASVVTSSPLSARRSSTASRQSWTAGSKSRHRVNETISIFRSGVTCAARRAVRR